jgi:hypothetical protein
MNWDERRPLNVALSDRKKNGRAAKMLSVLRDGQPHTRAELHERSGFYLTNNAASELRREVEPQGYGVAQWCVMENGERVYCYELVSLPKPEVNRLGPDASGSENELSPQETGATVEPPAVVSDIAEAGGSLPCSPADDPDGRPAGRHPSSAKQLEIWSAA